MRAKMRRRPVEREDAKVQPMRTSVGLLKIM